MKRKMTWVLAIVAIVCLMTVSLVGCQDNTLKVSIDNKSELTAEWYEGGTDRTVQISFSPAEFTADNTEFTVKSSDSKVVSVNGTKLSAKGAGTATITVTSGEASDSVDITVSPVLKNVTITNKKALTAVWMVGDADRTVEVALSPEAFTEANTTVTVTSSAPSIVSVSGKTLHAVAQGTATITVKAGDFTDTVEVAVLPSVDSLAIANKDDIAASWSVNTDRTITLTVAPDAYTAEIVAANAVVTCEPAGIVEVNGLTLTAVKPGTATITVRLGDKTDTVSISVVATAPTIRLGYVSGLQETDDGYLLGVMAGTEATLPTATAKSWNGKDVTVVRNVDSRIEADGEGKVTADKGVYTITYTATDPTDSTLVSTVTLKFVSARKIFAKTDGTFEIASELDEDSKQTVTVSNNGFQNAQFNLTASKLYYAEATFNVSSASADNLVGLAHFVPTDVNGNNDYTRWLASIVDRGNRDHRVVDFDTSHAWSVVNQTTSYYQWRLGEYRGLPDNDAGKVTYAIARVGDYFYTFVNGAYVDCVTLEHYRDNDTLPGIFGLKMNTSTIGNIVFMDGEEAQIKINMVLRNGAAMITPYVPGDWAKASLGEGLINAGEVTDAKGINFTYTSKDKDFNGSLVSPYIYFDKDFSFEWTYKNTDCNTAGWSNPLGMLLEVRPWNYGDQLLQFGMRNDGDLSSLMLGNNAAKQKTQKYTGAEFKDSDGNAFDVSQGVTFKLVRRLWTNKTVFTMTITSVANPSQTYTDTYHCTQNGWDGALLLSWHNTLHAGEYTNIKWEVLDPTLEGVEIANKDQLTQDWFVGDDDRTINVNLIPDVFTAEQAGVTIESSATNVITVVDGKLHAVGAGTATITVKAGTFTDTVTITVLPAVEGLALNVGETLSLEVGEDITLVPTVTSEGWTAELIAAHIAVAAKESGYLTIDGLKLTALVPGETNVTVSLGGKSVTFKVVITGTAPTIEFGEANGFTASANGGTLDAYQGEATMPTATAKTWNGTAITVSVTYPDGFTVDDNGKVTAANGTYNVRYTATDPENGELVTVKEIVVNIARKVFGATDNTWTVTNEYVADSAQTIKTKSSGTQVATFAMSASKLYYAEATFTLPADFDFSKYNNGGGDVKFGLLHAVAKDINVTPKRNLVSLVNRGTDDITKYASATDATYEHFLTDWNWNGSRSWSIYQEGTFRSPCLPSMRGINDTDMRKVTYAIARDGDYFYTFINGQYVDCISYEYYRDNDTIPGIQTANGDSATISNIVFVGGEQATAKLNALLATAAYAQSYVPAADWKNSANTNGTLFTNGTTTDEKGINFTYNSKANDFNGSMISPYVYFDKSFSFEWTYKNTDCATASWSNPLGMLLELRSISGNFGAFDNQLVQFGMRNDGDLSCLMIGDAAAKQKTQKYTGATFADTEGNTFDVSQGVTFKITRRVESDKAVITMTITSVGTPTQTYTDSFDCTATGWNKPILMSWHNTLHAGEYSNVKWEVLK